jgi:hypothetical protein
MTNSSSISKNKSKMGFLPNLRLNHSVTIRFLLAFHLQPVSNDTNIISFFSEKTTKLQIIFWQTQG